MPLLTITDGAAGLITAVETELAGSLRQRCLIHYVESPIMPMDLATAGRGADLGLRLLA